MVCETLGRCLYSGREHARRLPGWPLAGNCMDLSAALESLPGLNTRMTGSELQNTPARYGDRPYTDRSPRVRFTDDLSRAGWPQSPGTAAARMSRGR